MQGARRQGLDLPWWDKVKGVTFADGKLSLPALKVSLLRLV